MPGTLWGSGLVEMFNWAVSLKHDGTDRTVNTDGTAIERADGTDGTANTGAN